MSITYFLDCYKLHYLYSHNLSVYITSKMSGAPYKCIADLLKKVEDVLNAEIPKGMKHVSTEEELMQTD